MLNNTLHAEQIKTGDILFYAPVKGDIFDALISWYTHSPYCHVAIALNQAEKIEALSSGVVKTSLFDRPIAALWTFPNVATTLDAGITFLTNTLGAGYSYIDIADALISSSHFYAVEMHHYDCSALATDFLVASGVAERYLPTQLCDNPHTVTPALLAQALHPLRS